MSQMEKRGVITNETPPESNEKRGCTPSQPIPDLCHEDHVTKRLADKVESVAKESVGPVAGHEAGCERIKLER
jgi:hypothetical protein